MGVSVSRLMLMLTGSDSAAAQLLFPELSVVVLVVVSGTGLVSTSPGSSKASDDDDGREATTASGDAGDTGDSTSGGGAFRFTLKGVAEGEEKPSGSGRRFTADLALALAV